MKDEQINEDLFVLSEFSYQLMVRNHPDPMYVLNQEGQFLECNPAAELLTGIPRLELLKFDIFAWVNPTDRKEVYVQFHRALSGSPAQCEITMYSQQGKDIKIDLYMLSIQQNENKSLVYVYAKDITNKKKSEEIYRQADKLATVGELAAGVAHEIRNPMTTLKGFLQLMKALPDRLDYREYIEIMLTELARIEEITSELLMLAKPQVTHFEVHNLIGIVNDVLNLVQAEANLRDVQLIWECNIHVGIYVYCKENQIKQVLINVIQNAIEAMPEGGVLRIQIGCEENQAVLKFIDSGQGIPEEQLSKLGEPFYTTKDKGTGLGLMVSRKIVRYHGGTIQFISELGKGTQVVISIPMVRSLNQFVFSNSPQNPFLY